MKELDIIEEITEPTDWVSPMVPVPKANGDVRNCVDLRKLNQAVIREKYILPTFDDIIHQLRGSTTFSKLDAQSGFWQLPLDRIFRVFEFVSSSWPSGNFSLVSYFMLRRLEITLF